MASRSDNSLSIRHNTSVRADPPLIHRAANVWSYQDEESETNSSKAETKYTTKHLIIWTKFWRKWRSQNKMYRYFRLRDKNKVNSDEEEPVYRGWRKAVIASAVLTFVILIINIVFLAAALAKYSIEHGVGLIYHGDCGVVKRWDTILHLVINILGTALLAASSYCMQCLSSPSRSEVDAAHARGMSLDIGIASFTNFLHMRLWKGTLWLILCLSTIPLHLLWNSAIFSTTSSNLFSFVLVRPEFLEGAPYRQPSESSKANCSSQNFDVGVVVETIYAGYRNNHYTNLSAYECVDAYTSEIMSGRRNLILMTTPAQRNSAAMSECGFGAVPNDGSSVLALDVNVQPKVWGEHLTNLSGIDLPLLRETVKGTGKWRLGDYTVSHCMVETESVSHCRLEFTTYILFAVVSCNAIKLVSTIGDAVASFLENTDDTTKGFCLLDLTCAKEEMWENGASENAYDPFYHRKRAGCLYSATTHTRWWLTVVICSVYVIAGFALWRISFMFKHEYSVAETMMMKFGGVDGSLTLGVSGAAGFKLILDIVIANSFQLALSSTYFLYNSLYTAQCGALEWSQHVKGTRRALRVTWPQGHQRSTFWLQLPYRYGIPLVVVSILMHFLVSQSIFLARLHYYDWLGDLIDGGYTDVGYSPRAVLTTCIIGAVLVSVLILHSFRKLDTRIPIHGNKSTVVSAMCHPPCEFLDESNADSEEQISLSNIATEKITWGVTRKAVKFDNYFGLAPDDISDLAGHCNFSKEAVSLPIIGLPYR